MRDLKRRGMLEALSERVRIRREGGYAGIDIVLVLLYYFASGLDVGLRRFWERASPVGIQLAAVAGRRHLASPASVSRALEAVEFERVRSLAAWLLAEVPGIDAVLRHPAVQHYDASGEGWHVFDFDLVVEPLLDEPRDECLRRTGCASSAGGRWGRRISWDGTVEELDGHCAHSHSQTGDGARRVGPSPTAPRFSRHRQDSRLNSSPTYSLGPTRTVSVADAPSPNPRPALHFTPALPSATGAM